jgi:3-oxoacyl-[acyl-carrier-protein] synthase II
MHTHWNHQNKRRNVFLYAASVVAPGAANLTEFLSLIEKGKSSLSFKKSFSNLFLEGVPKFDFSVYKHWLTARHGPKRYTLLNEKSGDLVKYSVGSFIDALSSCPGLERALKALDPRLTIQYANGLGDLPIIFQAAREKDAGFFEWNAFWAHPSRNEAHQSFLEGRASFPDLPCQPPHSFPVDSFQRHEALGIWNDYWAQKSSLLAAYLEQLKTIEQQVVTGQDIELAKLALIRSKTKARKALLEEYQCPTPPWECVSPNLLWNVPNVSPAQISMLLELHGVSTGFAGACASFGTLLDNALLEIHSGRTDVAIIGATDATPSCELISAFYNGRLAVLGDHSLPFCDLRGTHISGGACTWILGAQDALEPFDVEPLPVQILGAGVSSDGEHIITPSREGPKLAIKRALHSAQISSQDIHAWDMHATGTPGDWNEFMLIEDLVPKSAYISARKGIFGHGMSASGGWELTAQLLGAKRTSHQTYLLPSSGIDPQKVNPKIAALGRRLLLNESVEVLAPHQGLICGKLSMGLGGTSSCVFAKIG